MSSRGTEGAAEIDLARPAISRHKPARDVCHGKRGTIHQAYRDGVEDRLCSLSLVLSIIVLWTTRSSTPPSPSYQAEGHASHEDDEGADRTPTSGDAGISGGRVLGNRKDR